MPFCVLRNGGLMTVKTIKTSYINNKYDNSSTSNPTAKNTFFADELSKAEMRLVIDDRIEYLAEKIKNGDTEVSYQIGASSFTEREWNIIIEKYDDIQEELKVMMREEQKKREDKKVLEEKIEDENEKIKLEEMIELLLENRDK